jgi:hypothetical protein
MAMHIDTSRRSEAAATREAGFRSSRVLLAVVFAAAIFLAPGYVQAAGGATSLVGGTFTTSGSTRMDAMQGEGLINGTCGSAAGTCLAGTIANFNDSGATTIWDCEGSDGGTNALGCSAADRGGGCSPIGAVKSGSTRGPDCILTGSCAASNVTMCATGYTHLICEGGLGW